MKCTVNGGRSARVVPKKARTMMIVGVVRMFFVVPTIYIRSTRSSTSCAFVVLYSTVLYCTVSTVLRFTKKV